MITRANGTSVDISCRLNVNSNIGSIDGSRQSRMVGVNRIDKICDPSIDSCMVGVNRIDQICDPSIDSCMVGVNRIDQICDPSIDSCNVGGNRIDQICDCPYQIVQIVSNCVWSNRLLIRNLY